MKSSYLLSIGLVVLCQCTGTETGNPVRDDDVQVAFAPLANTVSRRELGDVAFDRVSIEATSLSLEPCNAQKSTVLLPAQRLNLLGGNRRYARIPAGTYCAVRIGLGNEGNSFAASRSVSNGRTTLTFESHLRADVRLQLGEPLVTDGITQRWIVGVDLAEWLEPLATWLNSDVFQSELNGAATSGLREAQARSLRLYTDDDDDGQLDPAEVKTPLSEVGTLTP